MGIGLFVVKTTAEGQEWSNTWGVGVNGEHSGVLTAADIDELRQDIDFTNPASTGGAAGANRGETSPLAAILAFHRLITFSGATITGMYMTDGKDQPTGDPSTVYWSQSLNLPCLLDAGGAADTRVPLSIAWLINRNPAGYGLKPGRIYMRYALSDQLVRPGTRDGVQWRDEAASQQQRGVLAIVNIESELSLWYGDGQSETGNFIGLPRYAPEGTSNAGDLIFLNDIQNFTSHDPVSRQLTRGKRKKKAAGGGVGGGVDA